MAGSRTPLMAGNWKMNLDHYQATHLVQKLAWTLQDAKHDFSAVEVVVTPPYTDLRSVQTLVDGDDLEIRYGAQDCSPYEDGAHTGDISARMLSRLGCSYVVVGHSERRQYHVEDDGLVAAKAAAVLRHDMVPIICIGEDLDCRKGGTQVDFCLHQLDGTLSGLSTEQAAKVVIAYEPVWAIGTGEVATPADAQEVCGAVRGRLAELYDDGVAGDVRVLYGGSVKSGNIASIMAETDVDGALVGGASLDAEEFAAICRYQHHRTGR